MLFLMISFILLNLSSRKTFLPQRVVQRHAAFQVWSFSLLEQEVIKQHKTCTEWTQRAVVPLLHSLCISAACHRYLGTKIGVITPSPPFLVGHFHFRNNTELSYDIMTGKECLLFPHDSQAVDDWWRLPILVALYTGRLCCSMTCPADMSSDYKLVLSGMEALLQFIEIRYIKWNSF